MIGIIWNCRGVPKKGLNTFIKDLIWEYKTDFIGLQETMKKSYTDKFIRKIDSNKEDSWYCTPSNRKSTGMLSGIKNNRFDLKVRII
jgi:hypothetical protein